MADLSIIDPQAAAGLWNHAGHRLEVAKYPDAVTLECMDCAEVVIELCEEGANDD